MKRLPSLALSVIPALGMLVGVAFLNRAAPLIVGLPPVLAWVTAWVVLILPIMVLAYRLDPENHTNRDDDPS